MKKSKASFLLILPLTLLGACSQGAIASSENSKPSSSPSNLPESHPTSSSKESSSILPSTSSVPSSSSMPTSSSSEEVEEIEIKYEGYLKRQNALAAKLVREESVLLPEDIDYKKVTGLRLEAADKLNRIRPVSFGQAARISGVNPADLQVLSVWIAKKRAERK